MDIYYEGEKISSHKRLFGKNQHSYHLEDYIPLLEERPRAILDAAPVKQNVPPEILSELRKYAGKQEQVLRILRTYSGTSQSYIKDPVKVRPVDLHQYDILSIGKEVNVLES